jgi:hypothetical protein
LDAVIQAVLSGDRALMESFVQLQDVPCGFDFDSGQGKQQTETMDEEEKQKIMEQLQMLGYME